MADLQATQSIWIVVGVVDGGDTVIAAFASAASADAEAMRLNRDSDRAVYDAGYEVRGPIEVRQ